MKESLGIPNYGPHYLKMPNGDQNPEIIASEFILTNKFITDVALSNTVPEFQSREKELIFINYGSTQLVYVLIINGERHYTLVVNQPATPLGVGKTEFDNLRRLSKANGSNVITPLYYFSDNNTGKELYVTPYYYQARCIGVEEKEWGIWVPEPEYVFHEFGTQERSVINSVMVALLIKFYDSKSQSGLSGVQLDGGDFMLEKGFEDLDMNFENILSKIKLIAARSLVKISLDAYIRRIRLELSGEVQNPKQLKILGKVIKSPLSLDEIETGINLGIELMEKEKKKENERVS